MFDRTYWRDRSVEHPHRYTDENGNVTELTPEPGMVYESGTRVTQARMNNLETGTGALYAAVHLLLQQVKLLKTRLLKLIDAKADTEYRTAELPASGWSASAPYTQTVTVEGILATDTPLVDALLSDTAATAVTQLEAYGYVGRIDTGVGAITATCYEDLPTVDLTLALKVVR